MSYLKAKLNRVKLVFAADSEYILLAALLGIGLPLLGKLLHLTSLTKFIVFYLIIDGIYSIWIGQRVRKRNKSIYLILLLPIAMAIMTFLHFVTKDYGYALVFFYLILSVFTYTENNLNKD